MTTPGNQGGNQPGWQPPGNPYQRPGQRPPQPQPQGQPTPQPQPTPLPPPPRQPRQPGRGILRLAWIFRYPNDNGPKAGKIRLGVILAFIAAAASACLASNKYPPLPVNEPVPDNVKPYSGSAQLPGAEPELGPAEHLALALKNGTYDHEVDLPVPREMVSQAALARAERSSDHGLV